MGSDGGKGTGIWVGSAALQRVGLLRAADFGVDGEGCESANMWGSMAQLTHCLCGLIGMTHYLDVQSSEIG